MLWQSNYFQWYQLSMKTIKTINEVCMQILFPIKIGFNFAGTQILQEQMHGQMTFTLCVNKLPCSVLPNSVNLYMSTVCGELTGLQLRAECLLIGKFV